MLSANNRCEELIIKPTSNTREVFQKTAAKITIVSMLSRQIGKKSLPLEKTTESEEITEEERIDTPVMTSVSVMQQLPRVVEGSNERLVDGNTEYEEYDGVNGVASEDSVEDNEMWKVNQENELKDDATINPFDFMKERKLSEPVLSPRKIRNTMRRPGLSRCLSTMDVRQTRNETPMVLRELGGYKFFTRGNDTKETKENDEKRKSKTNTKLGNETCEVFTLKKIIEEQKENIKNREKNLLYLEKKLCLSEQENSKNKKQISSLKEKLKDCTGTMDYLRREKDVLATERDRLNFTLITCEHEMKELRALNVDLVTEYQSAEYSRKIAVSHLQQVERACLESHQDKQDIPVKQNGKMSNSENFRTKFNSMKDIIQTLRNERESLLHEQNKVAEFFSENITVVLGQVREYIKSLRKQVPGKDIQTEQPSEIILPVIETCCDEVFLEPDEPPTDSDGVTELDVFKEKLKSNEECIDNVANQIQDLESKKKGLLETRFAMIQEFQAGGRDIIGDWETDICVDETEERTEMDNDGDDRKQSRVTRKIRKLERTLSMDNGVGKLDCIQKLCKKLEESEQRIHELETTNSELRAEHDDMEEETKYLKYVLSYRSEVMKAQVKCEYDKKTEAMRDEMNELIRKKLENSKTEISCLSQRNEDLQNEVHRLHTELKTLLQNVPRHSSKCSDIIHESSLDISQNFADISSNLDNSENCEDSCETFPVTRHNQKDATSTHYTNSCGQLDEVETQGKKTGTEQSLEEKVALLAEEKRGLLLSMQTLTGQRSPHDGSLSECDASMAQNGSERNSSLLARNTLFVQTFQRIRNVLAEKTGNENNEAISKLKNELQNLDEKMRDCGNWKLLEDNPKTDEMLNCVGHVTRLSDMETEIRRLHDEKKSLLSIIVRLQSDPNFTLSDDVNDCSIMNISDVISAYVSKGDISYVDDVTDDDVISHVSNSREFANVNKDEMESRDISSGNTSCCNIKRHPPLTKNSSKDEETQVNIKSEDIYGLLGFLQQDLDKLRNALGQETSVQSFSHDPVTCPSRASLKEVAYLSQQLQDLRQHKRILDEKLQESESIRCDLHRTISIATDMATEERQKCEQLTRTKAALEKEMLTLAKENRDLREGLNTLSRARKRRNTRGHRADDTHMEDCCHVMYLPRAKAQNFSESEFSDIESPVIESKGFPCNP